MFWIINCPNKYQMQQKDYVLKKQIDLLRKIINLQKLTHVSKLFRIGGIKDYNNQV